MTAIRHNDILFDDFSILMKLSGQKELIATSVNTNCDCASSPALKTNSDYIGSVSPISDCDCIGYNSTSHYDDRDPDQIAPFVGQTD